jgi:hypothetical protein
VESLDFSVGIGEVSILSMHLASLVLEHPTEGCDLLRDDWPAPVVV